MYAYMIVDFFLKKKLCDLIPNLTDSHSTFLVDNIFLFLVSVKLSSKVCNKLTFGLKDLSFITKNNFFRL